MHRGITPNACASFRPHRCRTGRRGGPGGRRDQLPGQPEYCCYNRIRPTCAHLPGGSRLTASCRQRRHGPRPPGYMGTWHPRRGRCFHAPAPDDTDCRSCSCHGTCCLGSRAHRTDVGGSTRRCSRTRRRRCSTARGQSCDRMLGNICRSVVIGRNSEASTAVPPRWMGLEPPGSQGTRNMGLHIWSGASDAPFMGIQPEVRGPATASAKRLRIIGLLLLVLCCC